MAPTKIFKRERFSDRRQTDNQADEIFLSYLYNHFGDKPFVRGNLDAGRINWLFEREVKSFEKDFDPKSYEAMLILDLDEIKRNFPHKSATPKKCDPFLSLHLLLTHY